MIDPDQPARNGLERIVNKWINAIDKPVTWFRETVVKPNQKQYPYYHKQYRRVPTIDECYQDDTTCIYEANEQFKRDRSVDAGILHILRERKAECVQYEGHEWRENCARLFEDYESASLNYFIKYGDLGAYAHVIEAYMKQKHRMVYERRLAEGTWDPDL